MITAKEARELWPNKDERAQSLKEELEFTNHLIQERAKIGASFITLSNISPYVKAQLVLNGYTVKNYPPLGDNSVLISWLDT